MMIETVVYVAISERIVKVKCRAIINTLTGQPKQTMIVYPTFEVPDDELGMVCETCLNQVGSLYESYFEGGTQGSLSSSHVEIGVMEIPPDDLQEVNQPEQQKETRRMRYYKEYWQLPLADIEEVSVRTQNWMIRSNINTLKDLSMLRIEDLASSRNMGLKSIMELIMLLYDYGLEFRGNVQRMMTRCPFKTQSMESLLDDGYEPLTHPYNDDEKHMIHFILKDMEEGEQHPDIPLEIPKSQN
ncbi:MAG: DNA-directed RNA polymerase subunit alpha C-terminal domain-containing protein [Verrucomicrobiota bacterium]|nr:DNA-directed RNA polymerase subunit alpha C-terminal domain-containing protein [Verrucomicrobiota bacterium]